MLNKHSSNHLPAFPLPLQWFQIGEDEVILPPFLLQLDVPLKDLCVLILESVVMIGDLLGD